MNEDNRIEQINEMLNLIFLGTNPKNVALIFKAYLTRSDKEIIKPVFDLFADAFLSLHAYSALMLENCWSQAGAVLRVAIEQISSLFVLSNYDSTVNDFLKINKIKADYYHCENEKIQKNFLKENNLSLSKQSLINYFDYGWISSISRSTTRDDIIKLSHLNEMLSDIKTVLNPFAHGKLTIFDFAGPDGSWNTMKKYGKRANMICGKLYDYFCCSLKHWTSEEFIQGLTLGNFIPFKELYVRLLYS